MDIQKAGSLTRLKNVLKRGKKMSEWSRIEDFKNYSHKLTGDVKHGLRWRVEFELGASCVDPINLVEVMPEMSTKDELDMLTAIRVRRERDDLLNHLMRDPIPSDKMVDLITERVKEINAILRS